MIKMLRISVVLVLFIGVLSKRNNDGPRAVHLTPQYIMTEGYQSETHHVTTEDGYILEMHRIPFKRYETEGAADRPIAFLMHGMLSASNAYIALGPEYSISYNLADAGFDVWMGNARGNKVSRRHVTLDPDDAREKLDFFDYTWEEIAIYDLPAMVDYILDLTGQEKLHYIGHSQGGTVFLVLCSMRVEYNTKFASAHLLAGVGYQDYFPNEELASLALTTDIIWAAALLTGNIEVYPPVSSDNTTVANFSRVDNCFGDVRHKELCESIGVREFMLMRNTYNATDDDANNDGANDEDANGDDINNNSDNDDNSDEDGANNEDANDEDANDDDEDEEDFDYSGVGGGSLKVVAHYGQNIRDKRFRRYHRGFIQNLFTYGSTSPPAYDLSLITVNVTMHYTINDVLLDERDVIAMANDMPNCVTRKVARDSFLHEDFAAAQDVKALVTDYMIEAMYFVEEQLGLESDQDEGNDSETDNNDSDDVTDSNETNETDDTNEVNDNESDVTDQENDSEDTGDSNDNESETDNDDNVVDAGEDGGNNEVEPDIDVQPVPGSASDIALNLIIKINLIVYSVYLMFN